ncbi:MAG: dTMP kinase [Burkholderiales bacterium]|nr:dTMP kinase [Burkholderiales bacterium]
MTNARFITVEGIDGAGKSSHLEFLAGAIRARGAEVVTTREPGGTPLGERLRELVLHEAMEGTTEALVMFAARREHLVRVIEPALARGAWVLSDRFSDATYAYQCGGRGLDRATFRALEALVHPGRQPDATFLFDLDPAVAYERQRAQSRTPDRFEREAAAFFVRVRDAYLERARESPGRVRVVDASGTLDEVRARLADSFREAFP